MNHVNSVFERQFHNFFGIQENRFLIAGIFCRNHFVGILQVKRIRFAVALKNHRYYSQFVCRSDYANSNFASVCN